MTFLNKIWNKICFTSGYIHAQDSFPYLNCSNDKYKITYNEILSALPLIRPGDIGLRRINKYFSNLFIPGFFKHSFIFTDARILAYTNIVEALDTGVTERHAVYPMLSDYCMILRPRNVSNYDKAFAVRKAESIVGKPYDTKFKFDIEKELSCDTCQKEILTEAKQVARGFESKNNCAFTCTEVIAYAYWHVRQQLGLYRHRTLLKNNVIIPDDFINSGWDIIWCSKSLTPGILSENNLHEYGKTVIQEWRRRIQANSSLRV